MEGLKSLSPETANAVRRMMLTACGEVPVTQEDWVAGYQLWLEARRDAGLTEVVVEEPVRNNQGLVLTNSEVKELRKRDYRDR